MLHGLAGLAMIGTALAFSPNRHRQEAKIAMEHAAMDLNAAVDSLRDRDCHGAVSFLMQASYRLGEARTHSRAGGRIPEVELDAIRMRMRDIERDLEKCRQKR